MSKLMKATLIGLAAAALTAPLAQADAFGARDVGRPADVGRATDVSRANPWRSLQDVKLGRRPNPWKVGARPQRLLPWASRDAAY